MQNQKIIKFTKSLSTFFSKRKRVMKNTFLYISFLKQNTISFTTHNLILTSWWYRLKICNKLQFSNEMIWDLLYLLCKWMEFILRKHNVPLCICLPLISYVSARRIQPWLPVNLRDLGQLKQCNLALKNIHHSLSQKAWLLLEPAEDESAKLWNAGIQISCIFRLCIFTG